MDPVAGVPNFFEKEKRWTYRRCSLFDNQAEEIASVLEGCIAFIHHATYHGSTLLILSYVLIKISSLTNDRQGRHDDVYLFSLCVCMLTMGSRSDPRALQ